LPTTAKKEARATAPFFLSIGARCTGTSFRLVNQPGYFSPREHHALEATLRNGGQLGPRT
jgi:hypothetical protein